MNPVSNCKWTFPCSDPLPKGKKRRYNAENKNLIFAFYVVGSRHDDSVQSLHAHTASGDVACIAKSEHLDETPIKISNRGLSRWQLAREDWMPNQYNSNQNSLQPVKQENIQPPTHRSKYSWPEWYLSRHFLEGNLPTFPEIPRQIRSCVNCDSNLG